ncbi:NADH dehydrogenase [ubiquinone] 1 alpha subcomplex subunit 5 [Zancudomyces culisetae]|uniref:NADH dehydrogenase [ubiquinone] 1 alpha subcomplex subunit 5 n=1 Tax=Zancudomyces culisetae TaxID=1213189 RepID=A0A1R1PSN5_ZANCU|nr:NADH dehydrogenase [ubiquinone] 1 alpha subcomplex subunit 5 [Zancudomyces culisetae]|eukprot:OMH83977.1 NADH dehydrogenase [ubiquinone] 1 alpha subcomplex subunit 5 [Zancudomyces culisetae]
MEFQQSVESITKHNLEIVKANEDVASIEEKIGNGQIEELIIAAKEELSLLNKVAEWKVWEKLAEEPLPDQWQYLKK